MAINFDQVKDLSNHPAITKPRDAYAKHRYSTPLFVARETFGAFHRHHDFSIAASLSFYALFALIPMAVLMFFMLSHLVVSSNYALVKLAILTSNLVPKFSNRIMIEVYNAAHQKAAWGAFGMFILFWIVTPLAGALRSAFHTIAGIAEAPSYIKGKIKDVFSVLGMLCLFFLFTFLGLILEKVIAFIEPSATYKHLINSSSSIIFSTLLITIFYRIFFPARIAFKHILIGAFATGIVWVAMQPAFSLFLSLNQSYSDVFGGMKNIFISIAWLYFTFIVFLLGTELISTLHKKDVLLLKNLFGEMPEDKLNYLRELMERYGKIFQQSDYIFRQGENNHDLYYVVSGKIELIYDGRILRELQAGDSFGEMALLTETSRIADAKVISDSAEIIVISAENIHILLLSDSKVTMGFLKQMALRLQKSHIQTPV
ncbi:cyclic nucleotide-binding protein [Methylovorus sp. MM2]|uniref:YhjD/YihY/BrkB family envelope integrity protein n=1 Tax=Methylovorus sp. MM2 TaxID=1848038 RepID=UPI0007DFA956|nr:YhjD/YihY/BrkB family envelope integrity protein [Methylovorus sp. MM2]OAM52280.1 cyclic nucleotide-binding protein [Methylovorus sp. MM2]